MNLSSSSLSLSRSTTPSGRHEVGSDHHNGMEIYADDRSMTPISEYENDDLHGYTHPFTIISKVRIINKLVRNIYMFKILLLYIRTYSWKIPQELQ